MSVVLCAWFLMRIFVVCTGILNTTSLTTGLFFVFLFGSVLSRLSLKRKNPVLNLFVDPANYTLEPDASCRPCYA